MTTWNGECKATDDKHHQALHAENVRLLDEVIALKADLRDAEIALEDAYSELEQVAIGAVE